MLHAQCAHWGSTGTSSCRVLLQLHACQLLGAVETSVKVATPVRVLRILQVRNNYIIIIIIIIRYIYI